MSEGRLRRGSRKSASVRSAQPILSDVFFSQLPLLESLEAAGTFFQPVRIRVHGFPSCVPKKNSQQVAAISNKNVETAGLK